MNKSFTTYLVAPFHWWKWCRGNDQQGYWTSHKGNLVYGKLIYALEVQETKMELAFNYFWVHTRVNCDYLIIIKSLNDGILKGIYNYCRTKNELIFSSVFLYRLQSLNYFQVTTSSFLRTHGYFWFNSFQEWSLRISKNSWTSNNRF